TCGSPAIRGQCLWRSHRTWSSPPFEPRQRPPLTAMLQFSFKQDQIIEFAIPDPAVERTLQDVHSRIPDAGPAPKGSHALIASLLKHSVDLVGDKGSTVPDVRHALAPHVAYHRGLIAHYSPTLLENAAEGFEVKIPRQDSANGVRQCVGELLGH